MNVEETIQDKYENNTLPASVWDIIQKRVSSSFTKFKPITVGWAFSKL